MKRKSAVVNIYNFIRMSHTEPTRFIVDDFETIREEIIAVKQFGFPGTYALKYDALMEPRYQALLKAYLDDSDDLGAWWEISHELCKRSGVSFRDSSQEETYDDRVDSAYSIGYSPEERIRLVDGYMADFYAVFGKYPTSIGSWVLDSVTMDYASKHYGVAAFAICRDQIGVDGFTLWGGYPNGAYYPSRFNEYIPATTAENQINAPVFRLLGPDPIYNFEAEVRKDLPGVYSLEPAWLTGRDPKWIRWLFACLCDEDTLGMNYAQVGQENNFLWENIKPGLGIQLQILKQLQQQGKLHVETMAATACRFRQRYLKTPPITFQASNDWSERNLSCQWYACAGYRLGLLGEEGHLRIRELFLYDEHYASRYLTAPMKSTKSNFDALPVLYPHAWQKNLSFRPYIRLMDSAGEELTGTVSYHAQDSLCAKAVLDNGNNKAVLQMCPDGIRLEGVDRLSFDALPVFTALEGDTVHMCHEGFAYSFRVKQGKILRAGKEGVQIQSQSGVIELCFGISQREADVFTSSYLEAAAEMDAVKPMALSPKVDIPALAPTFHPAESVFSWNTVQPVTVLASEPGIIRYTLDATQPNGSSAIYEAPLALSKDCVLRAVLFTPDGRRSAESIAHYRFGLKEMMLTSPTVLDPREVFRGNGVQDLLQPRRGTLDYLDGTWRGTLQDVDITCTLAKPQPIASVCMGFLSHHRSGIVYPESVSLYVGSSADSLELLERKVLPCEPGKREIEKQDVSFAVGKTIGAFRIVAHRYERMPQWCTYRGSPAVFTMTDNLIVVPETE